MTGKKGQGSGSKAKAPANKAEAARLPSEAEAILMRLFQADLSAASGLTPADLEVEATLEELLDEACELPMEPSALWAVAARQVDGILLPHPETGEPTAPWLLIVLDARSGEMLHAEAQPQPTAEDIAEVLLLYMLEPNGDTLPQRPAQILTQDGPLALALHMALARTGVKVEQSELPGLTEALAQMTEELQGELQGQQALAFLTGLPADETAALVAAFSRFLAADPWTVFVPNKPLYATWTGADGQPAGLYATVMGELGEEFGLSLYADWLKYALHLNNSRFPGESLGATGSLEALTLSEEERLHPDDLEAMRQAGLKPSEAPGLLRIGPDGVMPPLTPLAPLTAILGVLSERAERRGNRVTSLKAAANGVQVRYPAGPRDELSRAELSGSVRVSMQVASYGRAVRPTEMVFSGPAEMSVRKAMKGVEAWLNEQGIRASVPFRLVLPIDAAELRQEDAFLWMDETVVWQNRMELPDLTLAHLTRFPQLQDTFGLSLSAEWQPGRLTELSVASDARPKKIAPKSARGQKKK